MKDSRTTSELAEALGALLKEKRFTVATAESCTGGLIAKSITDVSGASDVFGYGWVTYANDAKVSQLGVSTEQLELHGAVSEQVARAMAEGAMKRAHADCAVSVTGIAGPTGGSPEKPEGTVFIGCAIRDQDTVVLHFHNPLSRSEFREWVCRQALLLLVRRLEGLF